MELKSRDFFTASNVLSLLRIVFIIPIVWFIREDNRIWLAVVGFLAIGSDYLDGYLARKLNQITELGKILDPVADKLAIGFGLIALYYFRDFPLWFILLVIGRDVLILLGSLILMDKVRRVTPSNFPGKVAVTLIVLAVVVFIFIDERLFPYLSVAAVIGIVYSFIMYARVFVNNYFRSESR